MRAIVEHLGLSTTHALLPATPQQPFLPSKVSPKLVAIAFRDMQDTAMGIEYTARLPSEKRALNAQALFNALLGSGEWVEHERSERRLSIRYAGEEARPHWPEDIVIELRSSNVHVLFHAGTAAQRRHFLGLMSQAVAAQELSVSFEED